MDIGAITAFVATAHERSFTAAAIRLGVTQSAVSKAVSRLERDLGVRLVNRSTRSVQLTTEGMAFFHRCRTILSELDEARHELSDSGPLTGTIRISAPPGVGKELAAPLARIADEHPELHFDVTISPIRLDFVDNQIDMAIWVDELPDSRLIARPLGRSRFVTTASSDYLRRFGTPTTIADLESHRCLASVVPETGLLRAWTFDLDRKQRTHTVKPYIKSNNVDFLVESAKAGMGIIQAPIYIVHHLIKDGSLEVILSPFSAPSYEYWLVYQKSNSRLRKFELVREHLTSHFAEPWFSGRAVPAR